MFSGLFEGDGDGEGVRAAIELLLEADARLPRPGEADVVLRVDGVGQGFSVRLSVRACVVSVTSDHICPPVTVKPDLVAAWPQICRWRRV